MKSLLILCAFAITGCLATVDPKCAFGESYWCSSLRAAKACGAVDHCKTTVWTNQILKQDGSEMCQFCESIIGDVRKFVQDKKTQAEISTFMSGACGIIPQQKIADECKYVVEFMLEELIQLISSEMDPQMICGLMGICSGVGDSVAHAPLSPLSPPLSDQGLSPNQLPATGGDKKLRPLVGVHAEPICTDCKKFFADIKNMILANQTEAEVEDLIDSAVCARLGSMEGECRELVHEFLPEIMQMMSAYYDPNVICGALGVCESSLDKAKNLLLFVRLRNLPLYHAAKQSSPGTCLMCKTVMTELQILDRDAKVQANVMNALKTQLCEHLGSFKATCVQAVETYGPELFELLATELDPNTRCRSLGFCAAPATGGSKPMLSLTPARPVKPLQSNVSPQCVLCEFVMRELKSLISDNATEAQVIAALEKVCSMLPVAVKDACTSFVDIYGPAIIEMLMQELDPEQVCTELGLCGSTAAKLPIPPVVVTTVAPPRVGETETCVVCETVVQYLEALLEQNATEVEIEMILQHICGYMPDPMATECSNLVKQYGDMIIHYLTTFASPKEVCTLIGVCSNKGGVVTGQGVKSGQDVKGQEEVEIVKTAPPMLGQNECSWGPAYWCASRENADKCNAVDHCKKKVWNQ